jgi:hypothetical protein
LTAVALLLALASIVVTRVVKAFTVAEVLAVGSFLAGMAILVLHRQSAVPGAMGWPHRLVVVGSLVGLSGVLLKLLFVALGIGVEAHDMADHAAAGPNPLLVHIHHLFFNIGFLFMLVAAIGLGVRRFRRPS